MSESFTDKMLDIYLSFLETKGNLINDPKIIEYCFNKSIKKMTSIQQIYEYFDKDNYEKYISCVTYLDNTNIYDAINLLYELMKKYRFYYKRGVRIKK
ncbi:hypothetical protein QJ854_gp749 [Moumouvirus goulette]|uniref:Repeat protein n=1 Tax=Moumouvirus goulette TaxID=1247379 RepID=M1PGC1_9VIRU|nr:hypothetical protein QJ854_gp749 [Moumouvirus goulette]AGF85033.1 hypothetical protein glt_00224 [Moumouvirus goulette]